MRRFFTWFVLICLLLTAVSQEADARRRRRRRAKRPAIINEKKLYERVGGAKTVSQIVDEWMRLNLADQRIATVFAELTTHPDRLAKFRRGLNDQICEIADGPCQYKGDDLKKAHASPSFGEDQFLIYSDNLFKSLQKHNVPEREKNELLARLNELRSDNGSDKEKSD